MFCSKCGTQLLVDYRFCHVCGNPVPKEICGDISRKPFELQHPTSVSTSSNTSREDIPSSDMPPAEPEQILRVIDVPQEVRKKEANITSLEFYKDHLIVKTESAQTEDFRFADYSSVTFLPAGKETQYAQVFLIPKGNPSPAPNLHIHSLTIPNKLIFCSGLLHTEPANHFAAELSTQIQAALSNFHQL